MLYQLSYARVRKFLNDKPASAAGKPEFMTWLAVGASQLSEGSLWVECGKSQGRSLLRQTFPGPSTPPLPRHAKMSRPHEAAWHWRQEPMPSRRCPVVHRPCKPHPLCQNAGLWLPTVKILRMLLAPSQA